jgi:hypothetical protein
MAQNVHQFPMTRDELFDQGISENDSDVPSVHSQYPATLHVDRRADAPPTTHRLEHLNRDCSRTLGNSIGALLGAVAVLGSLALASVS